MPALLPLALLFLPAPQIAKPLPRVPAPKATPTAPIKRRVLMEKPPLELMPKLPLQKLPLAKTSDGPRPLPSPTARPLPGAFKDPAQLRARTERAKAVDACLAKSGRWETSVNLQHMSVRGSDVDEIYGQIGFMVDDVPDTLKRSQDDLGYSKWWLYYDYKNVDFNKNPNAIYGAALTAGTPTNRGQGATSVNVGVFLNLYDEDGSRGGTDDDWFFVDGYTANVRDYWKNGQMVRIVVPSCQDAPTFQRETIYQISAHQWKMRSSNGLLATIRLRYWRT